MCSDRFAFSWPSVTHLTLKVSSRASANLSCAPAQASTASLASATHLDCKRDTSSARAAAPSPSAPLARAYSMAPQTSPTSLKRANKGGAEASDESPRKRSKQPLPSLTE